MIFIVAVHIAAAYAGSGTDCGYVVMSDDMKADSAIAERIMEAAAALPDGESVPLSSHADLSACHTLAIRLIEIVWRGLW